MKSEFNNLKIIADGQFYEIDGINIWDHQWRSDFKVIKKKINDEEKSFNHFEILSKGKRIEFIAGELSNCVWAIFTKYN